MATPQEEALKKQYGARPSTAIAQQAPVDVTAAPQSKPVAAENVAVNTKSSNGSAFVADGAGMPTEVVRGKLEQQFQTQPDNTLQPGTGVIQTNGQTIPVGGARRQAPSSMAPRPGNAKISNNMLSGPATPPPPAMESMNTSMRSSGEFGARASELLAEEKRLMADPKGSVGNGIVARGAANRAKIMQDLDAQSRGLDIQQQNADTSQFGARSQAADRLRSGAREDMTAEVDVKGKRMEQAQVERVNKLQEDFLKETDPAKKSAIQAQLTALTGKSADKYQPITGKDDLGNTIYLGAFDQRTGTFTGQGELANAGATEVPPGMKKVGTSGGKPVYEDGNGVRYTL
jgi:hypothetical protein